jgi:hypothetical protein
LIDDVDVALDDHGFLDFAGPDSSHYYHIHISQDDFGEREKVPSELRRP